MGFSVVSIIELLYFMLLRPFMTRSLNKIPPKKMWNTTISKLVSAKGRKWPVHCIRPLGECHRSRSMFREPHFNGERKRNPVAWMKPGKSIYTTDRSDVIYPFLE